MKRDSRGPILPEGQHTMMVSRIQQNDRTFTVKNVTKHVHRIYFDVGESEYYPAEYITESPTQNMFTEGETCCFRVTHEVRREIEKCVAAGGSIDDDSYSPMPMNVSGRSYTFAMAYAKDMAVAAIRVGHLEYNDADLMRQVKSWAWEMHQWLLDPKDPNDPENVYGITDTFPEYATTRTKPF